MLISQVTYLHALDSCKTKFLPHIVTLVFFRQKLLRHNFLRILFCLLWCWFQHVLFTWQNNYNQTAHCSDCYKGYLLDIHQRKLKYENETIYVTRIVKEDPSETGQQVSSKTAVCNRSRAFKDENDYVSTQTLTGTSNWPWSCFRNRVLLRQRSLVLAKMTLPRRTYTILLLPRQSHCLPKLMEVVFEGVIDIRSLPIKRNSLFPRPRLSSAFE